MSNQIACRITKVRQLTKTIRQVMLEPQTTSLNPSFKPGQWVDFFPKNFENPGGFSISSAPDDLPNVELAIRSSPHPVVQWVFSDNCKENEIVQELIFPTIDLSVLERFLGCRNFYFRSWEFELQQFIGTIPP